MNMEGPMVCGNDTPFGFRSTPKIFKVVADTLRSVVLVTKIKTKSTFSISFYF